MAFLEALYASTRHDEVALTHWSEDERRTFLAEQFKAQHAHYMTHYPDADWLVIIHQRERIGRLYLERWPTQHRIIDIALTPKERGNGFGAAILNDLIDEASEAGKTVSIHVEKNNPAKRLYERLGFEAREDKGVYDLLVRPLS